MPNNKIATCSYCGTRAALVLRGEGRHELACSSCGAPLHDLKRMKAEPPRAATAPARPRGLPLQDRWHTDEPEHWQRKKKKKKPKKSFKRRALGEIFDAIEDIFD